MTTMADREDGNNRAAGSMNYSGYRSTTRRTTSVPEHMLPETRNHLRSAQRPRPETCACASPLQIIIGAVAIQMVMVAVLVWNTTQQIQQSHAELLARSAEQQSVLMTSALVPGLAYSDSAVLQEVLGLVAGERDLEYAVVTGSQRAIAWPTSGTPPAPLPRPGRACGSTPGRVQITREITLEGQISAPWASPTPPRRWMHSPSAVGQRNVIAGHRGAVPVDPRGGHIRPDGHPAPQAAQGGRPCDARRQPGPPHRCRHQRRTGRRGPKPQCAGRGTGTLTIQPSPAEPAS
jgi:hypothetical protein